MRPKEFWRLHPLEFYWLAEARWPRQENTFGLTDDDLASLYQTAFGDDDAGSSESKS